MNRINVVCVVQYLRLKGRVEMGRKSRERMTGLTSQGRQERSTKRKEEEKEERRRARLEMMFGSAAEKRSKGHG